MNHHAFVAACGALALAGTLTTLSAQTPPPTPAPPGWPQAMTPAEPVQKPGMGAVAMTGCLTAADGTAGAKAADARYVLTNATMDRPLFSAPSPAPAGPTAPPAHPAATQYTVVAGAGVDLAAHVTHQVRLTGTMAGAHAGIPAMKPGDMPKAQPDVAVPPRPGDGPKPAAASFTASSITMIAATCTVTP